MLRGGRRAPTVAHHPVRRKGLQPGWSRRPAQPAQASVMRVVPSAPHWPVLTPAGPSPHRPGWAVRERRAWADAFRPHAGEEAAPRETGTSPGGPALGPPDSRYLPLLAGSRVSSFVVVLPGVPVGWRSELTAQGRRGRGFPRPSYSPWLSLKISPARADNRRNPHKRGQCEFYVTQEPPQGGQAPGKRLNLSAAGLRFPHGAHEGPRGPGDRGRRPAP